MGFFELGTAEKMLEKAKRELARLEDDVSIDPVFNFFVTAYHIVDTLPKKLKADVLKEDLIQRCADACNKAKHMKLDPLKQPKKHRRQDVTTPKHHHRCIVWKDGTSLEVVSFARDVIAKWEGHKRGNRNDRSRAPRAGPPSLRTLAPGARDHAATARK